MVSTWFRPVVKVVELYRTKKGKPVGDALLACGHTRLANMDKPPKRMTCWTCERKDRRTYNVVALGDSDGGATPGEKP